MITEKPLPNAPDVLVALQSKGVMKMHVKVDGKIVRSRDILWELLTDPKMQRPWQILKKRISDKRHYTRLWSEIVSALRKSRSPEPSRTKKRDHFLAIAEHAKALANTVAEGPLDRLAYDYFPGEMTCLVFKTDKWPVLGADEKMQIAQRTLEWWPSITELLEEVAHHAEKVAKEALVEERLAVNDTQDRRVNYFLQYLARHFRTHFNSPMKGVLADIASVVFEKSITLDFVKRALRHANPR